MKRAKAAPARPLTEAELTVLLREKFPAPEFAFMPQVRNGTGFTRRTARTADALAMSLWPSRGLELYGFELKSARADWMREKADPAKAEEIGKFCDRWWVVVGAESVIPEGELFPPTWGLLVPRAGKLVVAREAPKLQAQPLDRAQLAAILRRAAECVVPRAEIEAAVAHEREQIAKQVEERVGWDTRHLRSEMQRLQEHVVAFEKAAGIEIRHGWQHEKVGAAVRFILDGGLVSKRAELQGLLQQARRITAGLEEQLAAAPQQQGSNDAARRATGTGG